MLTFHGTHKSNFGTILAHGLKAYPGYVSTAYSADVAIGYASMMGGEKNFRAAGAAAVHVPRRDRICFIVDLSGYEVETRGGGLLPQHEARVYHDIPADRIVGCYCPID